MFKNRHLSTDDSNGSNQKLTLFFINQLFGVYIRLCKSISHDHKQVIGIFTQESSYQSIFSKFTIEPFELQSFPSAVIIL